MIEPFRSMIADGKRRDLEEHWRLLYVGLTRAAEHLVIAGTLPRHGVAENSWHRTTSAAMDSLGSDVAESDLWGEIRRWSRAGAATPRKRQSRVELAPPGRPAWLDSPAPQEETPPRPLAPSAMQDTDPSPPPSPEQRRAARRGTLLHALFDRLPAVAPQERRGCALAWLERNGVADAGERIEIADAALRVLEDPRFADLFSEDALAEAPIAATLPDGRVIAGTVDRLCVGTTVVKVIDFKTGRHVPTGADDVPASHRRQMTAYAEALAVIFPDRRIEAALLYTHGPRLIAVDG
jgi:ATP-dependent helicase/nuclease subunit A